MSRRRRAVLLGLALMALLALLGAVVTRDSGDSWHVGAVVGLLIGSLFAAMLGDAHEANYEHLPITRRVEEEWVWVERVDNTMIREESE